MLVPAVATVAYLYGWAADRYGSTVAFSVRGPETAPPAGVLGMLVQNVSSGGGDAEIVYEFVRSQQMVEAAMAALPLEEIFNRPESDPLFRLGEGRPIEDVVAYWNWTTDVSFDSATGIVRFEARAFRPEDAREITAFMLAESTRIVNALSERAREDSVGIARVMLADAEERLREVRRRLRAFRDFEQAFDPTEDARAALNLMATLEQSLAEAQVERDTQVALIGPRAPQVSRLTQRIESLQKRIDEERARLGAGVERGAAAAGQRMFSDLLGDYEELAVEREFAENAYVSALAGFEQAQIEARRQARYLSPHIAPTLSVAPQYPQRALIAIAAIVVLLSTWSAGLLVAYNIRDRR